MLAHVTILPRRGRDAAAWASCPLTHMYRSLCSVILQFISGPARVKEVRSLASHDWRVSEFASAGHYIPNLALEIVKYNDMVDKSQQINLKGFMAGEVTC